MVQDVIRRHCRHGRSVARGRLAGEAAGVLDGCCMGPAAPAAGDSKTGDFSPVSVVAGAGFEPATFGL